MSNSGTSSSRNLTLEDDGLQIVDSPTATTTPTHKSKPNTLRASPISTETSQQPDTVTKILQHVGYFAEKKLQESGLSRAQTIPHLRELAKLDEYPDGEGTNMPRANAKAKVIADPLPSHPFQPDYFRQESKEENVLRVWIPLNPNENPSPNLQNTQIPSLHHWSRASIVSLITAQISLTKQVFSTMSSHPDRYPTASRLNAASILSNLMGEAADPMKAMRDAHAILALRLKVLV